jgi:hypothetical protein
MSKGNSTLAKVPGNNFPSLFSAIALTCSVLVAISTVGSIAYILALYSSVDPVTVTDHRIHFDILSIFSGMEK